MDIEVVACSALLQLPGIGSDPSVMMQTGLRPMRDKERVSNFTDANFIPKLFVVEVA
jgi:hypothetical protein